MLGKTTTEVFPGRIVYIAPESRPLTVFVRLAQRRYVGEVVVVPGQAFEQLAVVELGKVTGALEQGDLAVVALLQQVNDHGLRAGETGAAGNENQVAGLRTAHEKLAVWT